MNRVAVGKHNIIHEQLVEKKKIIPPPPASVTKNFLGNTKAENYVHLVNDMLKKFKRLNVHMSIKIHFLFSHLQRFPENLEATSGQQDIKVIVVQTTISG